MAGWVAKDDDHVRSDDCIARPVERGHLRGSRNRRLARLIEA
jgi:hypothetical protein